MKTTSDDVIQPVGESADAMMWSAAFLTTPLSRGTVSLQSDDCSTINTGQFSQDHYYHQHLQHQQQHQCDERHRLSLAASFAVMSASHLPYSTLLQQQHLQLHPPPPPHHHHHHGQLMMTAVSMDPLQWIRSLWTLHCRHYYSVNESTVPRRYSNCCCDNGFLSACVAVATSSSITNYILTMLLRLYIEALIEMLGVAWGCMVWSPPVWVLYCDIARLNYNDVKYG